HEGGYRVRVVSTVSDAWHRRADLDLRRTRTWEWTCVALDWRRAPVRRLWSGARWRLGRLLVRRLGPGRLPPAVAALALARTHRELARAARARPAALFSGGTKGARGGTATAARAWGAPYALDLEDFHTGERADVDGGRLAHAVMSRIEGAFL